MTFSNNTPTKNLSCPDILPTELQGYEPDLDAIANDSQLVHPDSKNGKMYIMGTRLQTVGYGTSGKLKHKLPSCSFHDVDLAVEGVHIKTMTQGMYIFTFIHLHSSCLMLHHPSELELTDINFRKHFFHVPLISQAKSK